MNANPAVATAPAPTPFQSASLYVGDLHNEVTEVNIIISLINLFLFLVTSSSIFLFCFQSLLFELFNRVGPVASIRVCRDSVSLLSYTIIVVFHYSFI